MTIYKTGLLTSVFSQVINSIEKEYRPRIFLIHAQRSFNVNTKGKRLMIYLRQKEVKLHTIEIRKESETLITNPEWKKIIKTIREEGFGDLTVNKLGFITENADLKYTIENSINKKIAPTKFVILFQNSPKSSKEHYIKRELLKIMRDYAEKLGLKYATLELSGIYTLQDWRSERKYNLLTTKKINLEKKNIKEIIENIFKPTIRLKGKQSKIRFIKWYELGKGNVLKLAGFEKI